ncbi:hypothetical protein D3C87_1701240 [compost metagenome]
MYNDYFEWQRDNENIHKVFMNFKKMINLESDIYCLSKILGIVPTENDLKKYGNMLKKEEHEMGLRFFKKNSKVMLDWKKISSQNNVKFSRKPFPYWYLKDGLLMSGRINSQLFDIDNVLYGRIKTERDFNLDEFFIEIKASEFYKVIEEELEKEEKLKEISDNTNSSCKKGES